MVFLEKLSKIKSKEYVKRVIMVLKKLQIFFSENISNVLYLWRILYSVLVRSADHGEECTDSVYWYLYSVDGFLYVSRDMKQERRKNMEIG
jgi:hypothetical protein